MSKCDACGARVKGNGETCTRCGAFISGSATSSTTVKTTNTKTTVNNTQSVIPNTPVKDTETKKPKNIVAAVPIIIFFGFWCGLTLTMTIITLSEGVWFIAIMPFSMFIVGLVAAVSSVKHAINQPPLIRETMADARKQIMESLQQMRDDKNKQGDKK